MPQILGAAKKYPKPSAFSGLLQPACFFDAPDGAARRLEAGAGLRSSGESHVFLTTLPTSRLAPRRSVLAKMFELLSLLLTFLHLPDISLPQVTNRFLSTNLKIQDAAPVSAIHIPRPHPRSGPKCGPKHPPYKRKTPVV